MKSDMCIPQLANHDSVQPGEPSFVKVAATPVQKRFASAWLCCLALLATGIHGVSAQTKPDVALAGFAYSGAASTVQSRFPYSQQYEETLKTAGTPIYQKLHSSLKESPPAHLALTTQIEELKGRDRALAVALVISRETVTKEQLGAVHKLTVLIHGQTMFFDFKSMNVVRAYPISFAYIDVFERPPSEEEIRNRVRLVYEGANGKPGLLSRFTANVAKAELPEQVSRYIQVVNSQVHPEALEGLPGYIKSEPGAAETWAADLVSEAISTRTGIPIVPFAKGHAIGNVMSVRVSDGTVWDLKLPKPDYEISVEFLNFKKIKFKEIEGGATTFVYGAFSNIRIIEPLSNRTYLDTGLKNGETRVIPASQKHTDDFPHFYDAINQTFVKLAQAINGGVNEKWLKTAASTKDLDQQILQTQDLFKQCK